MCEQEAVSHWKHNNENRGSSVLGIKFAWLNKVIGVPYILSTNVLKVCLQCYVCGG